VFVALGFQHAMSLRYAVLCDLSGCKTVFYIILQKKHDFRRKKILLLLLGAELPLMVESFALLNDIFPFPSILDAGYPVFNLHLANILFNVILPSILGSSL